MTMRKCPALIMAAPASGQGKTTVTAALARYHTRLGKKVRIFKAGPDFLDPMILEVASGQPVLNIDLWMVGEDECRRLLYEAAGEADLILIEGVMGLYDGTPSTADIARLFNIPVLACVNGSAMAQTFGAIAYGLAYYQKDLPFAGILATHVNSEGHSAYLAKGLPEGLKYFGAFPSNPDYALPERHLGLHLAQEIDDLNHRLDLAADAIEGTVLRELPEEEAGFAPSSSVAPSGRLEDMRIAVARDPAFAFIYQENISFLKRSGAEVIFFSPLADREIPAADALYFPGGYPELFHGELARNGSMMKSIREHHAQEKMIVAECGGMIYLMESLTDREGARSPMVGLLPGKVIMQSKLAALGLTEVTLEQGTLRGHTFHYSLTHYSQAEDIMDTDLYSRKAVGGAQGEAVFRKGSLFASYCHWYFPSCSDQVVALFKG